MSGSVNTASISQAELVLADVGASTPTVDEHDHAFRRRMFVWTGARTLLATLVLLVALMGAAPGLTRSTLLYIAVLAHAASVLSLFAIRRDSRNGAAALLGADLFVTTGLCYVTGSLASPFSFLYGALVLVGAMVLGPRAAWGTAGLGLFAYLGSSWLIAAGHLPPPIDQSKTAYDFTAGEFGSFMLSNALGLSAMAVLSGNLASRLQSAGGRLREAQASVMQLARLNDDVVRSITSGLVTTDLEDRVRTINPAGAALFRLEPNRIIGARISSFFPEVEEAATRRVRATAQRPDGSRFPIGFRQSPLLDNEGEVTGSLIVFQDLTEIEALRKNAAEAERLASLGRLAAGLAHEIRNPLSSISGSVELVRDNAELDPEDARLLSIVVGEVERLDALVSSMLQAGRPSDPTRVRVDLSALVREVAEVAKQEADARGCTLDVTGVADSVVAPVDEAQIRQVVWNLLRNALQASPDGSVVHLDVRAEDTDEGPEAIIEVRDHGHGLSEDAKEHLFEVFFSGRSHGIGLGLALVQQIIRRHDGSIEALDTEGGGARFVVRLRR